MRSRSSTNRPLFNDKKAHLPRIMGIPLDTFVQMVIAVATLTAVVISLLYNSKSLSEIDKQRKAQYRPQLVLDSTRYFSVYAPRLLEDHSFVGSTFPFELVPAEGPDGVGAYDFSNVVGREISLGLHNVGLGTAIQVHVTFSLPIEHVLRSMQGSIKGFGFVKNKGSWMLTLDGQDTMSLSSTGLSTTDWEYSFDIPFLLPATPDNLSHPFEIAVPYGYFLLALFPVYRLTNEGLDDSQLQLDNFSIEPLHITATYRDPGGFLAKSEFELKVISSSLYNTDYQRVRFKVGWLNRPPPVVEGWWHRVADGEIVTSFLSTSD